VPYNLATLMRPRLATVDALRGLAALSVAWFHFTNGTGVFQDGWVRRSGHYGNLGVQVFFVISGFIIPYTLQRASYQSRDFFAFLIKRITRLDPPYLVNLVFCIAVAYVAAVFPGFHGPWPHYTFGQIAAHLGYVNSIVHKVWVNPVYWSLGIEFQYYLLIGVVFPALVAGRTFVRFGVIALLLLSSALFPDAALLFHYLPLFVCGILTFQCKAGLLSTRSLLAALFVSIATAWILIGFPAACAAMITALTIRFVQLRPSKLTSFGLISYSLYLVHIPIGGKIVSLGSRFTHSVPQQILSLATALAVTLAAAFLFYRFVELPSQRLSSSIKYGTHRRTPPSRALAATAIHAD